MVEYTLTTHFLPFFQKFVEMQRQRETVEKFQKLVNIKAEYLGEHQLVKEKNNVNRFIFASELCVFTK